MKEFHPFTPTHAAVIVVFLLMTGALVTLRRRLAGTRGADRMDRVVAAAALAVWVFTTGGPFLPGIYDIHSSLPLQVCHLTNLLTPVALATCWRPARALSYFWGLALSTQGFFT